MVSPHPPYLVYSDPDEQLPFTRGKLEKLLVPIYNEKLLEVATVQKEDDCFAASAFAQADLLSMYELSGITRLLLVNQLCAGESYRTTRLNVEP